jgi:hypothetical protein
LNPVAFGHPSTSNEARMKRIGPSASMVKSASRSDQPRFVFSRPAP